MRSIGTKTHGLISLEFRRAKKIRASLRKPGHQTNLRVPSIPSVAWQPYPSPLGRLRAHSFASPPHDGFAFVEDGLGAAFAPLPGEKVVACHTATIGHEIADANGAGKKLRTKEKA